MTNIRCGNSLVGPDFYKSYQIDFFDDEQQLRINAFEWKKNFPFLSKDEKFNFVIGNPPYLYSAGNEFIDYFNNNFKFSQYQTDYYVYFIEAALKLLTKGGMLGFIVPDSWLNSNNFSNMRHSLLSHWRINRICIFTFKVFRKANIENSILFASENTPNKSFPVYTFDNPQGCTLTTELNIEDIKRIGIIDPYYSREAEEVIHKLDIHRKFGDVFDLNRGLHAYRADGYGKSAFGSGPQTKRDLVERSYHSSTKDGETYLPEFRGRDVFWLSSEFSGEYISYGKWLAEPRDPRFMMNPKLVCRKTLGNILPWPL